MWYELVLIISLVLLANVFYSTTSSIITIHGPILVLLDDKPTILLIVVHCCLTIIKSLELGIQSIQWLTALRIRQLIQEPRLFRSWIISLMY